MNPEVLKYSLRAIVRYLDGDINMFAQYVDKAMKLHEEDKKKERLYITIEELLDLDIKEKLKNIFYERSINNDKI